MPYRYMIAGRKYFHGPMRKPSQYRRKRYFKRSIPRSIRMRPELKYVDTSVSSTPSDTVGTVVIVNNVGQDTSVTGRIGNTVLFKSIQFTGVVNQNISATFIRTRVAFILDRFPNGTPPTVTDIYAAQGINQWRNLASNKGRFRTLWMRIFQTSDADTEEIPFRFFRRIRVLSNYSSAGAMQKGGIYMVCATDEATNTPTVTGICRMRFTDS